MTPNAPAGKACFAIVLTIASAAREVVTSRETKAASPQAASARPLPPGGADAQRELAGHPVSHNFYWLPAKNLTELADLDRLPPVRLNSSCEVRREGRQYTAKVRVENPTDHVAFLIHLVLTKGPCGEEILPVLWDDNYFSLAPGESRKFLPGWRAKTPARLSRRWKSAGGTSRPTIDAWRSKTPREPLKPGQLITVWATIADTFPAGSRLTLLVDGQPASSQWAWARGDKSARISFEVTPDKVGSHRLVLGGQTVTIDVQ